jgi:hypothetical protein
METLKHVAAFAAIAALFVGFIALLAWDYENAKARCPGYYNINYGCAVPR